MNELIIIIIMLFLIGGVMCAFLSQIVARLDRIIVQLDDADTVEFDAEDTADAVRELSVRISA